MKLSFSTARKYVGTKTDYEVKARNKVALLVIGPTDITDNLEIIINYND